MSKSQSITENSIHNTLLHIETLVVGAILVAAGFAISGFSTANYSSTSSFVSNLPLLVEVFIGGGLISFGLIIAYSQQYLGFAVTSTMTELRAVGIAAILIEIGQFLVGLGNGLITTQPFYGYIILIAGYSLFVVSLVLSGNTGLAISKLTAPRLK